MPNEFLIYFLINKISFMNFKSLFTTNFESQVEYFHTHNSLKY